jgi:hypothetical protein
MFKVHLPLVFILFGVILLLVNLSLGQAFPQTPQTFSKIVAFDTSLTYRNHQYNQQSFLPRNMNSKSSAVAVSGRDKDNQHEASNEEEPHCKHVLFVECG